MIILATLFVLAVICFLIAEKTYRYDFDGLFIAVGWVFTLVFVIALLTVPVKRFKVASEVEAYKAATVAIEKAKLNNQNIENAALQVKMVELNHWRAKNVYYRDSVFGVWFPSSIDDLQPIEW